MKAIQKLIILFMVIGAGLNLAGAIKLIFEAL